MLVAQAYYSSVWIVLFMVGAKSGERLAPLVLIAKDLGTDQVVELGVPKLLGVRRPPYPTGPQALIVAIDAHEVMACHLALGWRLPERVIDLMVEFHVETNGGRQPATYGLAGALLWHGLPCHPTLYRSKSPDSMRHRLAAVRQLFDAMRHTVALGHALLRGRYLCAVAKIEATGIPVDQRGIERLASHWPAVRSRVIESVDRDYRVYRESRFDVDAFSHWLRRWAIAWPRTPSGGLDLGDDAWRAMARLHEAVRPLKELRTTLHAVDPGSVAVGRDGRNRTPLRPFATVTGRNAPSAKASVLGSAAWLRHLVKPADGRAIALIDWEQQEYGIAAALSDDAAMQASYAMGDPYLALATSGGIENGDAPPTTRQRVREQFKTCALGVQYGIGPEGLARLLGVDVSEAAALIGCHRRRFSRFWSWCVDVETQALLTREQQSVFGWRRKIGPTVRTTSVRNFPMQANGAEMLRLACCMATEAGVSVCAPQHDALLIEATARELPDAIALTRRLMAEASEMVLGGFRLRTTAKFVSAPERWTDHRGEVIWQAVARTLHQISRPARQRDRT